MTGMEAKSQIGKGRRAPSERSERLMRAYDYLRKEISLKKLPPK